MSLLELIAPPKVNLFLHVTGKRADGYHLLDSLVVFPKGIGDVLTVETADRFSFTMDGPYAGHAGPDDKNLVMRAYHAFPEDIRPIVRIKLQKNIPAGAGLGGGSSDAAITVRALEKIGNAILPDDERNKLLLMLGADVPACYLGQAARMQGIGDTITPTPPLPYAHIVLCWPGISSYTKDVFGTWDQTFREPLSQLPYFYTLDDLINFLKTTENTLSLPAQKTCPPITRALSSMQMQSGCLLSRMSGSGSCVFGLFRTEEEADQARQALSTLDPTWWIRSGHI